MKSLHCCASPQVAGDWKFGVFHVAVLQIDNIFCKACGAEYQFQRVISLKPGVVQLELVMLERKQPS